MNPINFLFVGIGGFFGAIARFSVSKKLNKKEMPFPAGTLLINLLGSFLLGLLVGGNLNGNLYLLGGTGFLGAFTTFSTLNLELVDLAGKDQSLKPLIHYAILTYGLGILLAFSGFWLGEWAF